MHTDKAVTFTVNQADLEFILKQIVVAERETAGESLQDIIGPNAAILPQGLRHVDGRNNNLLPGGQDFGAADTVMPRLTDPAFLNDADGDEMPLGPPGSGAPVITNNNYGNPGSVADADPRTISNLIVDMSNTNPAAVAAWHANPLAIKAYEEAHGGESPPDDYIPTNEELAMIPNQSPDIGLSPQFNGWMTFFGQFFDHGLDLITKGGNGTVYIPLEKDDPLYVEGGPNFMALSRSTPAIDPETGLPTETVNTTTSWVDQNQTYTSHASHQVFLREYEFSVDSNGDGIADSHALATGRLLDGAHGGIANWGEVKAQALMLGIKLTDADVLNVPLLRTDAYGEFIRGPNGYAQIATPTGFVEGTAEGIEIPANAFRTGHAFLDDIAHHAVPGTYDHDNNPATARIPQVADTDSGTTDDGLASTYDDEMLNAHFVTGDGRGNENIGLTAVHTIFHAEHNRLVDANKATILESGDINFINEWLLDDITEIPPDTSTLAWDGERLFQAAKFVTEMQYQHMVFEEFARKVQPAIDPFVFTNTPDIDPSIVAEFAHAVYRFGHSMLTDTVARTDFNMNQSDISLFDAFLNPVAFTESGLTAEEAAGAIIRGMTRHAGNEIDEFVVSSLRSQLLGLPLDLAAINIARGREAGVAAFNVVRKEFYEQTGNVDLKPYDNWLAFAQNLKNPLSIVNFVAAYGTHDSITSADTVADKRAAAELLVLGGEGAPADRIDFLNKTGTWATQETGLNLVDLWIGGLAEKKTEFGGFLGSTFNFVFEVQMEKLQNGDRLYYLSRLQGTNLLNELEPNTFATLVMRNTDLNKVGSSHVSGNLFDTPDLILELNKSVQTDEDPVQDSPILEAIDPKVTRIDPGADVDGDGHGDGGFLRFAGGEHVVLGGTEGNDTLIGDRGIDALWGDGGDDYLNAATESDQVFGGDGDDIIVDPFGDNFLRGDAGNDVIVSGAGLNTLFGGSEQDFIVLGADGGEVFGGRDNDFILGGTGADGILGNEGDDWLEGGEGFDTLSGENSELFFNSPIVGHDVMNGQGNDTDYDGENGDDIMVQGPGIQRNNGMDGFDWAIHKGDPNGADSDLGIRIFETREDLILRDRFDSVEGLSGWNQDDILTGAAKPLEGETFINTLFQSGVDRIDGLRQQLDIAPGDPDEVAIEPAVGDEIIFGGDGSDAITGNLGNDFLDGDAWLNVRISVRENKDGTGDELFSVDSMNELRERMLTRELNPGQLKIIREVIVADGSDDTDTVIFSDVSDNYEITANENGTYTVAHTGGTGIDGIDTVRNVETLQFADIFVDLDPLNSAAVGTVLIDDTTPARNQVLTASKAFYDANGVNPTTLQYVWQAQTAPDVWTDVGTGETFQPGTAQVGQQLRVVANFNDYQGNAESITSEPTAAVSQINSPVQGEVTITGNVTEDQTLTANTSNLTDPNGLGTFSYQWLRAGVEILDATDVNYTLTDADVGQEISVRVSYTDGLGVEESTTSDPTAPVANVNDAPGGLVAIIGTAAENETLTADASGVTDIDGLGDFSYQWQRGGVDITGATGLTYQLTQADVGTNISVAVSYTDGHGTAESIVSSTTEPVANANNAPQGAVVITGDTTENETLTADTSGITDADELGTFSYQWFRESIIVTGATEATYTLTESDVGAAVTVVVSYTDGEGTLESLTSAPTPPIAADEEEPPVNNPPTGGIIIDDTTPEVNQTLTASNDIADADGLGTLSYQWQTSSNGTDWTNIAGATAASFSTTAAQSGLQLRVQASYVDNGGTSETVSSTPTAAVAEAPVGNVINGTNASQTLNGTAGVDIINALGGNDTLNGQGDNDFLYGGAGNDIMNGGAGNDVMEGGTGNDIYKVASAGDVVTENANEGTDRVDSSISYTLADNVENLTLLGGSTLSGTGNALNNVIIGNGAANQLNGGDGDDTISGGSGADRIEGGLGSDTAVFSGVRANYTISDELPDGTRTVRDNVGNNNIDTISGIEQLQFADQVLTLDEPPPPPENNAPTGEVSIDDTTPTVDQTLTVSNTLADEDGLGEISYQWQSSADGNTWNDIAGATAATFTVTSTQNNQQLRVRATYTDSLNTLETVFSTATVAVVAAAVLNIINGSPAAETLNGTEGNDQINGLGGNDTINANGGNDQLNGGGGADTMNGGAGDDVYTVDQSGDRTNENAGEGSDSVLSAVTHTLAANVENLTLTGSNNNNATGNSENNILVGNSGNNSIRGNAGNDTMEGGAGNDTYNVDSAGDVVIEEADAGIDTVVSTVSHTLGANVENLTLSGGAQLSGTGNGLDNVITGNTASNTLDGGAGNDTLIGAAGRDTLTGGEGSDTFDYNAISEAPTSGGLERIMDFLQGSDVIDLSGIDANSVIAENQAFNFISNAAFTSAGDLRFSFDGTSTILEGDVNGDLSADFKVALLGNINLQSTDIIV